MINYIKYLKNVIFGVLSLYNVEMMLINFIKNIKWVVGSKVNIKRGARMGGMPKCRVVNSV